MRLVVAHEQSGTRVYAAAEDGLVDLPSAAQRLGRTWDSRFRDVGAILRARALPGVAELVAAVAGEPDLGRVSLEELSVAPPVLAPTKIVCVGVNYLNHAAEADVAVPEHPEIFGKFPNALVGHGQPVRYPRITRELDYEGELAVIIGRAARRVSVGEALDYVAGYSVLNDVSARDLQLGDLQWTRGKSLDTFGPLGPYFVTADEAGAVGELLLETRVNGEVRQSARCGDMIFGVPALIAFITEAMTLEPGDVIATGTPGGVGGGMDPVGYLHPRDVVEVSISGLGSLRSPVVADD